MVLLDLAELYALHRVCLQHATDQVFAVRWNFHRHPVVALLDLHEEYGQLLVIEGQTATDHGVKDNAAAPDVDLLTTVLLTRDDLRRSVVRRAASRAQRHAIFDRVGEAEVDQLDVVVLIEQQILWLQVAVNHLVEVRVLDRRDYLLEDAPGFIFAQL